MHMKNLYTEIHDSVYLDSLGRCDYLGKVSDEVHWKIKEAVQYKVYYNNYFVYELTNGDLENEPY